MFFLAKAVHPRASIPALNPSPHTPYPPIADYGFLSDCEVTALGAPSGNVEWLCLPRLDSPSVFGCSTGSAVGTFALD